MKKCILFLQELIAQPFFNFLFLLTFIITVWFSMTFLSVEKTILSYFEKHFQTQLPPQTIRVTPRPFRSPVLFGIQPKQPQGSFINSSVLATIQKLPGIKKTYAFQSLQIPMQVQISLFGFAYQSDVVAIGVPWEFIQSEIPSSYRTRWLRWKAGDTIPALLPATLLDMYNQTLAKPNQLPTITEDFARGQRLRLVFGKSSLKSLSNPEIGEGELIGFSRKVNEIALILPNAVVEHYNKQFGKTSPEYSHLIIQADSHESQIQLTKSIRKLQLVVSTDTSLSEEILAFSSYFRTSFRIAQLLLWLLCSIAIALAALLAGTKRLPYYTLLRILGESRIVILIMVGTKYLVLTALTYFLATFSFTKILSRIPLSWKGITVQLATTPNMLFFWIAVAVSLFPLLSLFSFHPTKKL